LKRLTQQKERTKPKHNYSKIVRGKDKNYKYNFNNKKNKNNNASKWETLIKY
jgi:hypothetical protein